MKRIVLPGFGNPVILTPQEDFTITVMADGRLITVNLKANEHTKIEFLGSLRVTKISGIGTFAAA